MGEFRQTGREGVLPHRLTIRLDDEAWDTLQRISEITGVTMTAWVQALVATSRPIWSGYAWRDPHEWDDYPLRDRVVEAIEVARKIDTDRRRRGRR